MSNPTTNFNWQMPTSSDLVTDLPADFEVFGQAVDTTFVDLKGGTTGQVLSKASNTDMDFTWINADPLTILDAKGDLISATAADTPARLAVGTNGQLLTADSSTATGLAWTTVSTTPTFAGCSLYITSAVSINSATNTTIDWTAEKIDTDNFHSTVTNPSRITIPTGKAGKYAVYAQMSIDSTSASGYQRIYINVNGSGEASALDPKVSLSGQEQSTSTFGIFNLAVGDYLTMSVFQNTGSAKNLEYAIGKSVFMAWYLGA